MENKPELFNEIQKTLEKIRPYLQADGGDIELIEVNENLDVCVQLTGACHSCQHKTQTMYAGVERVLKSNFPEINKIIEISDE